MGDLVVWLRAQLDDDERTARAAGGASWEELEVSGWVHTAPLPTSEWQPPGYDHHVASAPLVEDRAHIIRHDPARVLREVAAKRQMLALHRPVQRRSTGSGGGTVTDCQVCSHFPARYPCATLRLLALPHADRPGYREEWRP